MRAAGSIKAEVGKPWRGTCELTRMSISLKSLRGPLAAGAYGLSV